MKYRRYAEYRDSGVEWLGEVPAHWNTPLLKHVTKFNYGDSLAAEFRDEDGTIPVFGSNGMVGVHSIANTLAPVIIVGRKGSYGKVTYSPNTAFSIDTTFFVDSTCTDQQLRWLYYALQAAGLDTISQDTGVPGLSREAAYATRFVVPSLGEQQAIVAFLDEETAQIDALIAKQERLIAVLQEKRQALISHAVTKGLNPDAPMKDSGVEWLGKVPAHWEVRRNKSMYQEIDDRSTTGKEELLSVSHITGVTARSEKTVNMFMAETLDNYKRCQLGDLVINTMWAYMGALGTAKIPGVVSPSYNVYRSRNPEEINPQYTDYLYRIPQHVTEIGRNSRGVWESRLRLYPDEFFDMRTPLPPRPEQDQIVVHIRQKNEQYALAEKRCQDCIELLQERRAALISAAVTGKIDVRDIP